MARIRTIKPEFFTSDDVCALSPLARLLFIGLWCEADREGRMIWSPAAFKRRYLPDDECDADSVARELVVRGVVVLYGDDLAYIPSFAKHQHVNPRESNSQLPDPIDSPNPRDSDASNLDVHVQVGREGKGKERKEDRRVSDAPRKSRLPEDWVLPDDWKAEAVAKRPELNIAAVAENFKNYWGGPDAKNPLKADWHRTWLNSVMSTEARGLYAAKPGESAPVKADPDKVLRDKAGLVMRGLKSQRTIITQEDYAEMVRLKMVTEEQAQDHGYRPKSDSPAPSFKIPTPGSQFTNAPVAPNTRRDVA